MARKTRKFIFEFYTFNKWQKVEIDDRLHMWSVEPYDKPALADEPGTGVYWAVFLEKVKQCDLFRLSALFQL